MKSQIRNDSSYGVEYQALAFICPGCAEFGGSGLHLLPVNTQVKQPSWEWDGDLESPTINPSILTRTGGEKGTVCHSYLHNGVFEYLTDSTHSLAEKHVLIPDLPEWFINETYED